MPEIEIKALRAMDEMRAAVDLQKTYWGNDAESVIPAHMLYSLANYGGHVLAAFDGGQMVGVLVGFLGTSGDEPERPAMANLQLVSKRMVVLPEHRGQGVGFRLKRQQRRIAIQQGVRLVTWTFDPLLALNAHLNIRKLGGISREYLADAYGTGDEGGLTTLGSSDRLLLEWWVTNNRVEERLNGKREGLTLKHYLEADMPILNPTKANAAGFAVPREDVSALDSSLVLIEMPVNYGQIAREDEALGRLWRTNTRDWFGRLFAQYYLVTDFVREQYEGRDRAFYVLARGGKSQEPEELLNAEFEMLKGFESDIRH